MYLGGSNRILRKRVNCKGYFTQNGEVKLNQIFIRQNILLSSLSTIAFCSEIDYRHLPVMQSPHEVRANNQLSEILSVAMIHLKDGRISPVWYWRFTVKFSGLI